MMMVQYRHSDQSLRRVHHVGRLQLRRQLPLPLVASVLKPDLHLRLGEMERRRETGALRARQIALHVERRLELEHLTAREHRPRLLLPLPANVVPPAAAPHAAVPAAAGNGRRRSIRSFPAAEARSAARRGLAVADRRVVWYRTLIVFVAVDLLQLVICVDVQTGSPLVAR